MAHGRDQMPKALSMSAKWLVLWAVFAVAFFASVETALDKQETIDCYKAQQMEQDFPLYETSTSTAQMCKERGVDVWKYVD